ncbi:MAG: DUF6017 domain-containing protein [Lachnospiraceae bacterium]|nr:DUF6017 domain-containing protein [Lachnospiraceae bacterium]
MAILKNKTQGNFTMISNSILRDKELSMKDRGVLCTIISLPDGWKFSEAGLSAIVPDGKESIRNSIRRLEGLCYLRRVKERDKNGKYISNIEVFAERETTSGYPSPNSRNGKTVDGTSVLGNQTQYNNDNLKKNINIDNSISINQSKVPNAMDGEMEIINDYRELISDNIKLSWLLEAAKINCNAEVDMVNEVYEVICDMVCFKRKKVVIKNTEYPWEVVKSRFLKLRYEHVADVLNRIVDAELKIKNMNNYLISTLFTVATVGTIELQAHLHDDYLKFLRGKPYG